MSRVLNIQHNNRDVLTANGRVLQKLYRTLDKGESRGPGMACQDPGWYRTLLLSLTYDEVLMGHQGLPSGSKLAR